MEIYKEQVFAKAKVNLALHVLGRRVDRYHFLDSLVVFPKIKDRLLIKEASDFSFTIGGEFSEFINPEENSVIKAFNLVRSQLPSNFSIHLEKNIPVGAGLGGGSADSAAVLRFFQRKYKAEIPKNEIIAQIGADVPVCLSDKFQRVKGIGEITEEISETGFQLWIVLVNPAVNVSTGEIFESLRERENKGLEDFKSFKTSKNFIDYLSRQRNDLQSVACEKHPEIKFVLEKIMETENNLLTRMTGTGSTCFGLYSKMEDAFRAQENLEKKFTNWWVKYTKIF